MSWQRIIWGLIALLLVCNGSFAFAGSPGCRVRKISSCCHSAPATESRVPRCSSSTGCNEAMHSQTAETATFRDMCELDAPVNADLLFATLYPRIATCQSTMHARSHPPLQNPSGFNPLLVSLQV